MATRGGGSDRRRLLIPQKKVWRQVMQGADKITTNINIPNDIVVEILLRLPAKSLVRFRWACKYWFDSITRDSNFAKMHAHRCSTTATINNDIFSIISPSVMSSNYRNRDRNKIFQCYLNDNDTTREVVVSSEVSIALPFNSPLGWQPQMIGSCNGLILLDGPRSDNLCIWNPCTREYKMLPHPLRSEEWYNIYGFGYDHSNDDYKVIRTAYYHDGELYSDVQVYSLGTHSWRRIGSNPYRLSTDQQLSAGVFVNGAIYWMDYLKKNIISFDCRTEKFMHVSQIPSLTVDRWWYKTIHVFEGSICVLIGQENFSDVWVMKDYAVKSNESLWTKLSTVSDSSNRMWPLKYTRNGEILMVVNCRDLVLYDQKNNNAKTLCRFSREKTQLVQLVYTESLVCLSSGTYKGQEYFE